MNYMKSKKGLSSDAIIALLIAIIIIVAAAIPVVIQIITDLSVVNVTANETATLTGTTLIIVNLIPLFLGLAALVATAKSMKG